MDKLFICSALMTFGIILIVFYLTNPCFRELDNVVLVHYREVKEVILCSNFEVQYLCVPECSALSGIPHLYFVCALIHLIHLVLSAKEGTNK